MSDPLRQAAMGSTVARATFGPLDRDDLRRYAEASGDLNPLHLDPAFASRAGFEDVIVHGMLGMALLGRLLTEAFPSRMLVRFRTRFCGVIPLGRRIECLATLTGWHGAIAEITLSAVPEGGPKAIEGTAMLDLAGSG